MEGSRFSTEFKNIPVVALVRNGHCRISLRIVLRPECSVVLGNRHSVGRIEGLRDRQGRSENRPCVPVVSFSVLRHRHGLKSRDVACATPENLLVPFLRHGSLDAQDPLCRIRNAGQGQMIGVKRMPMTFGKLNGFHRGVSRFLPLVLVRFRGAENIPVPVVLDRRIVSVAVEQRTGGQQKYLSLHGLGDYLCGSAEFYQLIRDGDRQILRRFVQQCNNVSHHIIDRVPVATHLFLRGVYADVLVHDRNRPVQGEKVVVVICLEELHLRYPSHAFIFLDVLRLVDIL